MSDKKVIVTQFLNVDLDIVALSGLDKLLEALKPSIIILNHDRSDYASVELADRQPQTIDEAILFYSEIILSLPPHLRAIWEQCERRVMNVGIEAGNEPYSARFPVSLKTSELLVSMKTELVFTVYQYDEASR